MRHLSYCLLNKTGKKERWGFIFNNKSSLSCRPPPHTHFAVLNVSSIPVHGHNSGSGSLNIEGNSIWPCSPDRTYGWTTCSSRGLLLTLTHWGSDFIGVWLSCDGLNSFLTVLLDVRASAPSSWGPWYTLSWGCSGYSELACAELKSRGGSLPADVGGPWPGGG